MFLCERWAEASAHNTSHFDGGHLLDRLTQHAQSTSVASKDASVQAVLGAASKMKLVEKAHAAGRVAKHISGVRLGAQNELVQYRRQQSLHELWCQSPFGNHRPPL